MPLFYPQPIQAANNHKIALKNSRFPPINCQNVRQVMASPPTVAWSTTNSITGSFWPAGQNAGGVNAVSGNYFTFTRCGSLTTGTAYPNYNAVKGTSVNYGGGTVQHNVMSVSFIHTGTAFSIFMLGYGEYVLIKVDDQYVSMTPQTMATDGNLYYGSVTFASAGRRRIEILSTMGTSPSFGGVYTAATDTIQPAIVRGPRVLIEGDSFIEGPLATAGAASNFPIVFGELMGWDDVWSSGVGSTGFLATSGNRGTYRSRLSTDVIPYNPDIVIFQPSINDSAYTPSQIAAEASLCFAQIQQNLPNALIACTSHMLKGGASYAASFMLQSRLLLKTAVQNVGGIFIDLMQMPVSSGYALQSTTLYASSSASATSLQTNAPLRPYATYQFADGSQFICTAASGGSAPYSATIDNSANAQSSGATIAEVGSCLWTGSGHVGGTTGVGNSDILVGSDAAHPTQAGHEAIGEAMAYAFLNQLYSN